MNPACFDVADSKRNDFGLQINGSADQAEKAWLPSVLGRVEKLAGNKAKSLIGNIRVNVHQGGKPYGDRCSSFTSSANSIELVTKCRPGADAKSAAAHFAHELGHIVGLRGYYASYGASNPVCTVTNYCSANHGHGSRNEEFAEVFATYLHAPNYLRSACPKQFEWMKANVFSSNVDPNSNCTGNPVPNLSELASESVIGHDPSLPISRSGSLNSQLQNFTPLMQQLIQTMSNRQQNPGAPATLPPPPLQMMPAQPQTTPVVPVNPWPEGAH